MNRSSVAEDSRFETPAVLTDGTVNPFLRECWRVLAPGGRVAGQFCAPQVAGHIDLCPPDVIDTLQSDLGFLMRGEIVERKLKA